ncbi:MAG: methyltransferase domain-containing protein [Planctomycetes bacterium]|nr:methyltransferase domain-containing protein [Planctomycetota bacterium]
MPSARRAPQLKGVPTAGMVRLVAETPYTREDGYARRYRDIRFTTGSGAGTDRRERAALAALLAAAARRGLSVAGPWLDAPSGAGRMSGALPGLVVQADRDPAMVAAAGPGRPRACASVHALPFGDGAFAGVLCHRLLQHIPGADERRAILAELARVSRGIVVVSFFDALSLQSLRRALRRWTGKTRSGRSAVRRGAFLAECRVAGLEPVAVRALRRFVGEQTLVLCVRAAR